jgi:Fe-S-cluster-containing dehydrogenase component
VLLFDAFLNCSLIFPACVNACSDAAPAKEGKENGKLSKRQRIKAAEAEKKRQKEEQFQQRLRVLRCPLCVAENVTVPADQVMFTANGTRAVLLNGDECEGGGCEYIEPFAPAAAKSAMYNPPTSAGALNKKIKFDDDTATTQAVPKSSGSVTSATSAGTGTAMGTVGKAAPTVCKWGGGYSSREEKGKSAKKRKLSVTTDEEGGVVKIGRPCKFGAECTRAGCWFQH